MDHPEQVEAVFTTESPREKKTTPTAGALILARVSLPMQTVHEILHEIAEAHTRAIEWATKVNVKDNASQKEAVMIGKELADTAKAIDARYLEITQECRDWLEEASQLRNSQKKVYLDCVKIVDAKIRTHQTLVAQEAEKERKRVAAELKAKQDAIEASRAIRQAEFDAYEVDAMIKSNAEKRKAEEGLKKISDEKERLEAQLKLEADEKVRNEKAEADRQERERQDALKTAAEEVELDKATRASYGQMAIVSAAGKPKNVRKKWDCEVVDEKLVPRLALSFDHSKVCKLLDAGTPPSEFPGVNCWQKDIVVKR